MRLKYIDAFYFKIRNDNTIFNNNLKFKLYEN